MAKKNGGWSPYGLEAIRTGHIRRRRWMSLLALLVLGIIASSIFQVTTTTRTSVSVNGEEVSNSNGGIQIQANEQEDPGPVTVGIQPGRVTRAESGQDLTDQVQRGSPPPTIRAQPINFNLYLLVFGPYALLALAAYFLAKKRGRYDEVNFGVYKGSMPLEMITASHTAEVYTKRHVKESIFGKRRIDHLPREVAAASGTVEDDG